MSYDIFGVVNKAVEKFDNETIVVVPSNDSNGARYLGNNNGGGYTFSQKQLLSDIDLAYNSKYKSGIYDKEGQRKLFLNIMRFYTNVAVKNTNVNISNYNVTPTAYTTDNLWEAWFFNRQFANFVRDENYGELIDDLNLDFNKYGTCLQKRVGDSVIRVPLRAIRCDQAATTLLDGIKGGTPLIQEHEMSYVQAKEFKGWEIPEDYEGKRIVYEVYMYMKKEDLLSLQGVEYEDKEGQETGEMVLTMSILMPTGKREEDKRKKYENAVLFTEQIDELPFEECHNEKQDGRWLGIGEAEKQIENQIARNLSANLRRRSMLWASKKIFQTQGDEIAKNLVKNVQDGEVLQVGLNGLVQAVDTSSRGLADFQQDEQIWEQNSKEQSFAFDAATGDTMPSGTPFRLGAILSNSAMSYFDGKKQKFGMFLERAFFSQLVPIFQKRAKDDIAFISSSEQGYEDIKKLFVELHVKNHEMSLALDPAIFDMQNIPSKEQITQQVTDKLVKSPFLSVNIPKEVYKNAKYKVTLDLTGQSRAIADRETLITLYTTMSQKQDPRAPHILDVILASMGKTLPSIAGEMPVQQQNQQVTQAPGANADLAGLLPQNANQQ